MNKIRLVSAAVLPAVLACGCSSLSHTENGALAGGAIGAGTGALISRATGHSGAAGALIGAGVGALSGGLIGHAADETEHRVAATQAQTQMGLTDVVQMTQSHVSDEVIINQIRSRGTVFHLSAQDTIWLKQQGVSDRVVDEMLATARRYPAQVVAPAGGAQVLVVEPAPPPPVVGVGFGYTHYGRRW